MSNMTRQESMTISWTAGVQMAVEVRGHRLIVDQPKEDGGDDQGITPVEMFVASLGACIGYFAVRFCQRRNLPTAGLAVKVAWDYAEQPHRVGSLTVQVSLPPGFPAEMQERLQKVVEGCTIHQSLTHSPPIAIALKETG
ncbi:MAG: OsmC family peroxiredoxin [Candidatus Manganitrophaceae bacterium]|nr:MAG: OsmC family peroxiredoxin [Candidatus Manganitrophaceae bacterium]